MRHPMKLLHDPVRPPRFRLFQREYGFVCQVCERDIAILPKQQTRTFRVGPFRHTVVTVAPLVCLNCRMNRHAETRRLGDGRRRFWKRVFSIWDGEYYPSAEPWVLRLIRVRLFGGRLWKNLKRKSRWLYRPSITTLLD